MSDEKKIEFSQSDVLNALLHQRNHEQHFATQESVDNVKEHLARFEQQTEKRFDDVDKRFDELKTELKAEVKESEKRTNENFKALEKKFERLNWFLVAGVLAIIFQTQIQTLFAG
ncbi:hypothetical protein [Vibrio maritimus]|uniref:hypothetical protein n=1 Tax=Vibrio maritimus TaxID=990268 RepID=UPI001F319068|nr:hypothetical protein [Vibrio maritimus]